MNPEKNNDSYLFCCVQHHVLRTNRNPIIAWNTKRLISRSFIKTALNHISNRFLRLAFRLAIDANACWLFIIMEINRYCRNFEKMNTKLYYTNWVSRGTITNAVNVAAQIKKNLCIYSKKHIQKFVFVCYLLLNKLSHIVKVKIKSIYLMSVSWF